MKHPSSATLLDHWLSIRRGRRVPDRNDLDPAAIRGVLGYTFILEADENSSATRTYPVRVSGTRLDALFGRSVKDMRFTDLWQRQHEMELRAVVGAVLDDGVPVVIGGVGAPPGYAPLAVEMLILPLRCRGRTHARLLCSLVPMTVPSWMGLRQLGPLGLTTWRMIETDNATSHPPLTDQLAPSPAFAPVLPETRPRFRVIEGGLSNGTEPAVAARKLALRSP